MERKRMALIERQATSLLMAGSEEVRTFDKAGSERGLADWRVPDYGIGNLRDSIRACGIQNDG